MRLSFLLLMAVALMLASQAAVAARSVGQNTSPSTSENTVVVRGRAACLDKHGQAIPSDKSCPADNPRYLFSTLDGKTYSFVPDDPLTAMFSDSRVRERVLQLTADQHKDGKLELISVQSVKDGKLYDIYYHCDICNITLYAPGLCPCCRRELEFKEVPASEP